MIDSFREKYRFLSNFWPAPITLDAIVYPTVEHAYQAAKTNRFNDRVRVWYAPTPGKAKRIGRKVEIRTDWEEVKIAIMTNFVAQKFDDPDLGAQLLATEDQNLIEGNTWGDTYWGMCNGVGENHLGRILMATRDALRIKKDIDDLRRR